MFPFAKPADQTIYIRFIFFNQFQMDEIGIEANTYPSAAYAWCENRKRPFTIFADVAGGAENHFSFRYLEFFPNFSLIYLCFDPNSYFQFNFWSYTRSFQLLRTKCTGFDFGCFTISHSIDTVLFSSCNLFCNVSTLKAILQIGKKP